MNNPIDNVSEVGSQKVVAAASYGASITTAAGGAFTVNDLALWGGLFLALLTFIVNLVYNARKDRREAELTRLESELAKARLAKELSNG
ncbi:HP1 family phage holin [Shewanella sp. Koi 1]